MDGFVAFGKRGMKNSFVNVVSSIGPTRCGGDGLVGLVWIHHAEHGAICGA